MKKSLSKHEDANLDRLYRDISRFESLSREEELVLIQKAQAGDEVALGKLVQANLKYITAVAHRMAFDIQQVTDLVDEGVQGFIKAVYAFDESRGYTLLTIADPYICKYIRLGRQNYRVVRLPDQEIRALNNKERDDLSFVGLDNTVYYDENKNRSYTYEDTLVADDNYRPDHGEYWSSEMTEVNAVLDTLPEKQAYIFKMCHGLSDDFEHSDAIVAFEQNLSRERVRQINNRVFALLQSKLKR